MRCGFIFDWDGVVVDSATAHRESWERLAAEVGRTLPADHFEKGFGKKNAVIIPEILRWTEDPVEIENLSLRKEALYREIAFGGGLAPLPGVEPFLAEANARGIPCAVGSSTARKNIEGAIRLFGFERFFKAIACGDDAVRSKPSPDVFLLAAQRLGVAPAHCWVFEDAVFGIEAALAAGMRAVGVATTHPPALLAKAHRITARLDRLDIDGLIAEAAGNDAPD